MAKTSKPGKDQMPAAKTDKTPKPGELSDDELKKVSGGPTAVEMPGRFNQG